MRRILSCLLALLLILSVVSCTTPENPNKEQDSNSPSQVDNNNPEGTTSESTQTKPPLDAFTLTGWFYRISDTEVVLFLTEESKAVCQATFLLLNGNCPDADPVDLSSFLNGDLVVAQGPTITELDPPVLNLSKIELVEHHPSPHIWETITGSSPTISRKDISILNIKASNSYFTLTWADLEKYAHIKIGSESCEWLLPYDDTFFIRVTGSTAEESPTGLYFTAAMDGKITQCPLNRYGSTLKIMRFLYNDNLIDFDDMQLEWEEMPWPEKKSAATRFNERVASAINSVASNIRFINKSDDPLPNEISRGSGSYQGIFSLDNEKVLTYLFTEFMQGGHTDLTGQIMMQLMTDMMQENEVIPYATNNGQDYFDHWLENAKSLQEQYDTAWLAENMPSVTLALSLTQS